MLNCSARCAGLCNSDIIPIVIRDHSLVGFLLNKREFVSSDVYHGHEDMTEGVLSPVGEEHLLKSHYSSLVEET